MRLVRSAPSDAFGTLMPNPPAWLAQEMAFLNARVASRDLRCLSVFVDDPALPPLPGVVAGLWNRLSGRTSKREMVLKAKGRAFFGISRGTYFRFGLSACSSGGSIYVPERCPSGQQLALVVHHPLNMPTPDPDMHDPARGSVSGDDLRRALFLMLVGRAINANSPAVISRVLAADQFAVQTFRDRGEDALAAVCISVRALDNLRSMRPVGFNVLALRAQMGCGDGTLTHMQEAAAMHELHIRLTHPDKSMMDARLLRAYQERWTGFLHSPRDRETLVADLARLETLRDVAPLSPEAGLMAGILLESAQGFGLLPSGAASRSRPAMKGICPATY